MRHTVRKRRLAGALFILSIVACGGPDPDAAPVRVVVPQGASFRAAAESLASSGVVGSGTAFRYYARVRLQDRDLKPGTYSFVPGTPWGQLLDALNSGRGLTASVTIPEGWALSQIVPALAHALEVPEDSVAVAVRDTTHLRRLEIPTETLEGYLFPATYTFPIGTSARVAVKEIVAEFERRWQPEWDAGLATLSLTRHEGVTLASIVEREARVADERPTIAAVYHNRLRINMPLQADPTVQYARGEHTERVMYRDLEVESPYNTYRNPGLPPGPIASPGSASLAATAAPADVPFLYFVAHPDGHHEFRSSYAEHLVAVREMRRLRDSPPATPTNPTKPTTPAPAAPSSPTRPESLTTRNNP